MKVLLVCLLCFSLALLVSPNPVFLESKKDVKLVDVLTCIKCEAVIQLFNFLNDAIIGGKGEEDARQTLLAHCKDFGIFKDKCIELTDPKMWDTIYKALRDSLGTFYQIVAIGDLQCPALDVVRAECGVSK